MIEAVISDFGGVLTTPLFDSFLAFEQVSGISPEQIGAAMGAIARRNGGLNPLFELETGRMSERDFLAELGAELSSALGRETDMSDFGERYFAGLQPNQPVIDYMRELRERGYKLALCTNNVREWEPLWRPRMPIDEIFELVVDSGFVGMRKPEPGIYALTLERLGVGAGAAVLLDDIEVNCTAAREHGLSAVWFQSTEQALAELTALLA